MLLDAAPARERPLGNRNGLSQIVVDGVLGEPLANHVHEVAVAQRIYAARRNLDDVVAIVRSQWATGSHGADGGHHEVDGDDVDGALRDPGELLQEAPGVGDDDRLGHPETSDPARRRFGQR